MYIKKNWLSVCQSVRFSILQTVTTHSMVTLQEDVEGAGLVVTDPLTEQVKKKNPRHIIGAGKHNYMLYKAPGIFVEEAEEEDNIRTSYM